MSSKHDVRPFKIDMPEAQLEDMMTRPLQTRFPDDFGNDRFPVVGVPTAVSIFPGEIYKPPLTWTKKYFNLKQYRVHTNGGHFAPLEVPEVYVDDVRTFFRTLR